jgi:ribosome-associated translation inhibitor RaiA
MRVTITGRHVAVPAELRGRARALVDRLARLAPRGQDARVLFADDHGVPYVELRVHVARGAVLVGRAEGPDHRTALDRAAARVRRQVDKSPAKRDGPARRRAVARGDR